MAAELGSEEVLNPAQTQGSFILSTQEGALEGSYLCSYQDTCYELTLNGSVAGSFDDIRKSTCIRPLTQGPFVRSRVVCTRACRRQTV